MMPSVKVAHEQYPVQRIFCIGMNYREHILELGSKEPDSPVIFMKPASSLVFPGTPVKMPTHGNNLHYEAEVVLLIGKEGKPRNKKESEQFIVGLGVGLDLTLRDVQNQLKASSHP